MGRMRDGIIDALKDEDFRRRWRGIHLPPSAFDPTGRVEEKGPVREVPALPGPEDDVVKVVLREAEGGPIEESAIGDPPALPNVDTPKVDVEVVEPQQRLSQIGEDGYFDRVVLPSNPLHPDSYSSQPSVPLYPLLFVVAVYAMIKHVFLRRVFTYQKRTRLARSVRHKMLNLRGRLSLYGGNYEQFAISQ